MSFPISMYFYVITTYYLVFTFRITPLNVALILPSSPHRSPFIELTVTKIISSSAVLIYRYHSV